MPIPTDLIDASVAPASVATACTAAITVSMTSSAPQPVASRTRAAISPVGVDHDGVDLGAADIQPDPHRPASLGEAARVCAHISP